MTIKSILPESMNTINNLWHILFVVKISQLEMKDLWQPFPFHALKEAVYVV
jgi:hypothetical protein